MPCNISETKWSHRRFNGARRTGTVQLTRGAMILFHKRAPQQNFKMEPLILFYERIIIDQRLGSEPLPRHTALARFSHMCRQTLSFIPQWDEGILVIVYSPVHKFSLLYAVVCNMSTYLFLLFSTSNLSIFIFQL